MVRAPPPLSATLVGTSRDGGGGDGRLARCAPPASVAAAMMRTALRQRPRRTRKAPASVAVRTRRRRVRPPSGPDAWVGAAGVTDRLCSPSKYSATFLTSFAMLSPSLDTLSWCSTGKRRSVTVLVSNVCLMMHNDSTSTPQHCVIAITDAVSDSVALWSAAASSPSTPTAQARPTPLVPLRPSLSATATSAVGANPHCATIRLSDVGPTRYDVVVHGGTYVAQEDGGAVPQSWEVEVLSSFLVRPALRARTVAKSGAAPAVRTCALLKKAAGFELAGAGAVGYVGNPTAAGQAAVLLGSASRTVVAKN